MQEIKNVRALSLAKICGLFGIFFGLLAGILMALASNVATAEILASGYPGFILGWKAIIILPILYGGLYFIGGAIGAWFYNLFAKWVGGVSVGFGKGKK